MRNKRPRISDDRLTHSLTVDEDSDQGDSKDDSPPSKRPTVGFCRKCARAVGEFYDSWVKVTGTYYLPTLPGSYTSRLVQLRRRKEAAQASILSGCFIKQLVCPHCEETLGFTAIETPDSKQLFRHRDFFKLTRIDLKCEHAGSLTTVDPHIEPTPDYFPRESDPEPVNADAMEIDSARAAAAHPPHVQPPPPLPSDLQRQHHHQPLQPVESNRQPTAAPVASPGPPPLFAHPQKSPSNPHPSPVQQPIHDPNPNPTGFAPPPPPAIKEANVGLANRSRELPTAGVSHQPAETHRPNGQYYPRSPQEIQLDAIGRLQNQISQNSGALTVHGRDLRRFEETVQRQEDSLRREFQGQLQFNLTELKRVDDAVGRLQHEMRGIREMLEGLSRDVHAVREMNAHPMAASAPPAGANIQDSALELMAGNLSNVAQKANEVDTLKLTIEIMKGKIQRLEDATANPPTTANPHPFASPREPSIHSAHSSHTVPSYHPTPINPVPHINTPVHPTQRPQPQFPQAPTQVTTQDVIHKPEPPPAHNSGWTTVNPAAKRAHPNGVEGPHETIGQSLGSPKRPKLAPIEPRLAFTAQPHPPHQQQAVYEHMDTDESGSRHTSLPLSQAPSQPPSQPREPHPETPAMASQFITYSTQEAPADESWRPESQRGEYRSPRGGRGGRGGGPGSRGGRPRKSLPTDMELGTPEWEKEDWQGLTHSQMSPDGFYNSVSAGRTGRGIVRRGSGGAGTASRGPRSAGPDERAVSLGLQGVTPGPAVSMTGDPYAHTKKTRTKPIRNADGILIRKDGRPDMRSQSSAANLRKVHLRKEEQKAHERSFTPTLGASSSLQHGSAAGPDTPSPANGIEEDVGPNTQRKHEMIMHKIFPGGVEEHRGRHDYAKEIFGGTAVSSPLEMKIKREHHEQRRVGEIASPDEDGDVDMERDDRGGETQGETPSGHSEGSESHIAVATQARETINVSSAPVLPAVSTAAETTQTLEA